MRRLALSALLLLTLAACGADGAPEAPGLKVEGEASVGVVMK